MADNKPQFGNARDILIANATGYTGEELRDAERARVRAGIEPTAARFYQNVAFSSDATLIDRSRAEAERLGELAQDVTVKPSAERTLGEVDNLAEVAHVSRQELISIPEGKYQLEVLTDEGVERRSLVAFDDENAKREAWAAIERIDNAGKNVSSALIEYDDKDQGRTAIYLYDANQGIEENRPPGIKLRYEESLDRENQIATITAGAYQYWTRNSRLVHLGDEIKDLQQLGAISQQDQREAVEFVANRENLDEFARRFSALNFDEIDEAYLGGANRAIDEHVQRLTVKVNEGRHVAEEKSVINDRETQDRATGGISAQQEASDWKRHLQAEAQVIRDGVEVPVIASAVAEHQAYLNGRRQAFNEARGAFLEANLRNEKDLPSEIQVDEIRVREIVQEREITRQQRTQTVLG